MFLDPMAQFYDGLIFRNSKELLAYFEKFDPQEFRVICRFREDETHEETETALRLAMELKNTLLVIDEVDRISREGAVSKTLWSIFNYYRHDKLSVLCCARRPARVSRDLTGNADEIICFKVQEPLDLKYLSEYGYDENTLKNLNRYEYISTLG
jgi:hypothetical protein